ncbi:MAG: phospholipase A [Nitrosomonadales bacterium]|nr:phospholipase A [Nitrosomonadales bacterium]
MHRCLLSAGLLSVALPLTAFGADMSQCATIAHDGERLKCYDAVARPAPAARMESSMGNQPFTSAPEAGHVDSKELASSEERSYLTRAWNLDGQTSRSNSIGRLKPHRASYFILRESSRVNLFPNTPAPGHATVIPQNTNDFESKFQFSFKSEVWGEKNLDLLGFKSLRIWAAYTQQSNWQMFNTNNSSPFRESSYEPEVIATLGTGKSSGLKLVNLGFVHQSNGQPLPASRGWNRLYAQGGWEWDDKSLLARIWWRLPESALFDDNPDIEKYVGIADMTMRWEPSKEQTVTLLLRNNLRMNQNRGFMQLDWATPAPLGNFAKLHLQFTSGYGESLIDYNHRQNTIGLGFSFRDW